MRRRLVIAGLVILMLGFGIGVYHVLDSQKRLHTGVDQPTDHASAMALPGTMYLAQGGALYRFHGGSFTKLTNAEGWVQPALSPDGTHLVAVKRAFNFSDIYLLDTGGHVQQQLTHNASNVVEHNHWAFYPRFSADGQTIYYSYDPKDPYNNYHVDLAIYAIVPGSRAAPRQWTYPNEYTGGDVTPIPLKSGALLYAKNSIDGSGKAHSQVWIQARAGSAGLGLTQANDDCGQPAVSPDGGMLAMVCRHGQDIADIEVATLDASHFSIGSSLVVVPPGLNSAPAFSPDGRSIAYFAPSSGAGPFQLWTVAVAGSSAAGTSPAASTAGSPAAAATPAAPRQVTQNLGFDSSAAPVWS